MRVKHKQQVKEARSHLSSQIQQLLNLAHDRIDIIVAKVATLFAKISANHTLSLLNSLVTLTHGLPQEFFRRREPENLLTNFSLSV